MGTGIKIDQLSVETRDSLARYTRAINQYEFEQRRIYSRDGGHLEIPPSGRTIDEWSESRADLKKCPEPAIKELVYRIQIERVDEAMADETKTEVDVLAAAHNAKLAENELVSLGQQIIDSSTPKPNQEKGKWSSRNPARRRKSQFRMI
jgi:hypothetical protein